MLIIDWSSDVCSSDLRGKDEAWLILAAEPDSTIALGTKRPVGREELRDAALDGSIEDLLDWKPVKAGDFYYSPAGTVHAIGAGIKLRSEEHKSELQSLMRISYAGFWLNKKKKSDAKTE